MIRCWTGSHTRRYSTSSFSLIHLPDPFGFSCSTYSRDQVVGPLTRPAPLYLFPRQRRMILCTLLSRYVLEQNGPQFALFKPMSWRSRNSRNRKTRRARFKQTARIVSSSSLFQQEKGGKTRGKVQSRRVSTSMCPAKGSVGREFKIVADRVSPRYNVMYADCLVPAVFCPSATWALCPVPWGGNSRRSRPLSSIGTLHCVFQEGFLPKGLSCI